MMNRMNAQLRAIADRVARTGAAVAAIAAATSARAVNDLPGGPAVNQLNLHPPVTQIAADQIWLHYFMLIICVVIFVGVFGVMFYSIFKHRKSKGHKAAQFHESTTVEIVWTVVPFIIVILMALPATKVVVAMKDTSASDLTIKATGIQWKWGYDYLKGEGEGISFLSTLDPAQREMSNAGHPAGDDYLLRVDNPLVVPVNKKVRIITTANDVIHAWMVPAFGVKQDAIPGFVRDTWFRAEKVGDYYGQCAELCGKEHAYRHGGQGERRRLERGRADDDLQGRLRVLREGRHHGGADVVGHRAQHGPGLGWNGRARHRYRPAERRDSAGGPRARE